MKIDDYEYKKRPIETIKNWSIHSLEDNKEGVDKYFYNMKDSYVHNFLSHLKPSRFDKFYPNEKLKKSETDNAIIKTDGQVEDIIDKDKSIIIQEPHMKSIESNQSQIQGKDYKTPRTNSIENTEDKEKSCPYGTNPRFHHHKKIVSNLDLSRGYQAISNKNCKKTNFGDLAKSSILKPIHQCNHITLPNDSCSSNKKYHNDYSNRYSILRASIDATNRMATQTFKENPLGFTVKNVPKVPMKSNVSPSNTFKLCDERMKTSVLNGGYVEENDKLTKCLNDYDSLNNFPKITSIMNQNQIKNVQYRLLGKCMGEKYNPSNYNLDFMKSTVKRNEIGTKLH